MREKLIYYKQYYNTYIYVIHVITQKQLLVACLYQILGTAKQKKLLMLSVIHNTRIIKCTTNFNEAKNNYMYQKELYGCCFPFKDLVKLITLTETLIARATSLKAKFPSSLVESSSGKEEVEKFISDLLHINEVPINGGPTGPVGNMIHKLFVAAQRVRIKLIADAELNELTE